MKFIIPQAEILKTKQNRPQRRLVAGKNTVVRVRIIIIALNRACRHEPFRSGLRTHDHGFTPGCANKNNLTE